MKKFYLDLTMIILLLATMSFHFIPKALHEVFGLALLVVAAAHLCWNLRALRNAPRTCATIDVLITIGMIVVVGTGVCISNHLFNGLIDMKLQRNITIHQLHVSMPFALMILLGLHLGINWSGVRQRILHATNLNPPSLVSRSLVVGLCIAGIVGAHLNQLPDRLRMMHIFATPASQLPFPIFLLLMIGMLALFTTLGSFINRIIKIR